jgi:hypothetical protein
MLCRLQSGRIRRQEEQVRVVRHTQTLGALPASAIQREHNLLVWRSVDGVGERGELGFEKGMLTEVAR